MSTAEILFVTVISIIIIIAFIGLVMSLKNNKWEHIGKTEFQDIRDWLDNRGIYLNWIKPNPFSQNEFPHQRTYILRRKWVDADQQLRWNECQGLSFRDFYENLSKIRIMEKDGASRTEVRDALSIVSTISTRPKIKSVDNIWKD
ncbi:hypothetical protein UGMREWDR_CDS0077 [Aeromonas phage GomatiRiver_11]|nr:hypothetical protein OBDJBBDK_00071 [Aeromonas phage AhFM11]WKW84244.1 hypothetical protein UGMREWDR_CDS0077 [Aeromonas phage GomatiRiver_11]